MAGTRTAADANIVLGGLLFLWGFLIELYLVLFHVQPAGCAPSSIGIGEICYTAWYYGLIPMGIGFILMATGTFRRPIASEATDLLRTDPFTIMILLFLATATAVSAGFFVVDGLAEWISGELAPKITLQTGTFSRLSMAASFTVAFGIMFLTGFGINAAHVRRRRRFVRSFNRAVARHAGRN